MMKKLVGNKGSIRDMNSFISPVDEQEYVVTAGCDRNLRVFKVNTELQKETEVGHCYLKQKLNCLVLSKP